MWARIVRWLFWRCYGVTQRRGPDLVIGEAGSVYLNRWWLIPRNPVFNVYLHVFQRSDDDRAHHDHPWVSLSLILHGGYIEHRIRAGGVHTHRRFGVGALIARHARYTHRIEVPSGEHVTTLFVTGPVLRRWGFHGKDGWVRHDRWDAYVAERGLERAP